MTFTHNFRNDTTLERDGNTIIFSFIGNDFLMEEQDHMEFNIPQSDLFRMLGEYFEEGKHAEIFDELTLPGQDALWNALVTLDHRNETI